MISQKKTFDSNFEVFLADTLESQEIHYNVRYKVYCEEMGFEDKELFPNQMEFDEYDSKSVHFLVRHKWSGQWIGAMRLILSDDGNPFPMEQWCELNEELTSSRYRHSVELSRLCVLKETRRFSAKNLISNATGSRDEINNEEKSNIRLLNQHKNLGLTNMWGLLRAASKYCAAKKIDDLFLFVTSALAFSIRKQGFVLDQLGEPAEHKGKRVPFLWKNSNLLVSSMWETDFIEDLHIFSEEISKRDLIRFAG